MLGRSWSFTGTLLVLYPISWEPYERLLADNPDRPFPRLAYDRGTLEILVNKSTEHEETNRAISLIVDLVAAERGIDVRTVGSMLFKRADLDRGVEPDTCFSIEHERDGRGVKQIDPTLHRPKDLVIEVDVSGRSLNTFRPMPPLGCRTYGGCARASSPSTPKGRKAPTTTTASRSSRCFHWMVSRSPASSLTARISAAPPGFARSASG